MCIKKSGILIVAATDRAHASVGESKVQPATALQLGVADVIAPLVLGHAVPDPVALLVAPDIISLGQEEEDDDEDVDAQQDAVAAPVFRLVVVQIDEVGDDTSYLYHHLHGCWSAIMHFRSGVNV